MPNFRPAVVLTFSLLALAGCATSPQVATGLALPSEPRIKPLSESELPASEWKTISGYRLANGQLPNILTTLAGYPALLDKYLAFVSRDSTLAPRDRELLVLRVGWLRQADFMLAWHTLYARNAGLSEEEIARVAEGPGDSGWSVSDATLLRAADELIGGAFITDATWSALGQRFGDKQLLDLVFLVGQYDMISMYLKSAGVPLDQGVPRFPVRPR